MPDELNLLSDLALGDGEDLLMDGLGFKTYASVLSDAARGTLGPFTIGVFGEWGTGKTSLMRLIQQELRNDSNVVTVWFNAWRYEKEEHPIVPLVGTIIRSLEAEKRFLTKAKKGGQSLLKALRAVAYGFSAKSKVKVPGFAEIEASFIAKDMIERSERLTPDPLLDRSLYYQAFESLSDVKLPPSSRVVVFVDDLDRCFPDLAIRLLESIKLVLSQPGFIFVLGVARQVIEGYLQHRYSKDYGIKDFKGGLYLDKIVQLPFHIPPHSGKMMGLAETILNRLNVEIREKLNEILPLVGDALGSNPRALIRFVNNILIDIGISDRINKDDPEIPVEYFAISRCLQHRWPDFYFQIAEFPTLAEEVASWEESGIRKAVDSDDQSKSELATTLISDKNLRKILLETEHGRSWLSETKIRESTIRFINLQGRSFEEAPDLYTKYDLFLSYSSKDKKEVSRLAEILSNEDLKVFVGYSEISVGSNWKTEIDNTLQRSKALAICVGPGWSGSGWLGEELKYGLQKSHDFKEFKLIPILLPGSDSYLIPADLKPFHWLDLRDGISLDKVAPLIKSLKR